MSDKKKIIGHYIGTTLNPAILGGGGGGGGAGTAMIISASKPYATNCVWFNTSCVAPVSEGAVIALTDDTESGVVAEVNGVEYGVANIKANDDPTTVEYDYTLI